VRACVRRAYELGARFVDLIWRDEESARLRFEYAPRDSFGEVQKWYYQARVDHAAAGEAFLSIAGSDPNLLAGQDPGAIAAFQRASQEAMRPVFDYIMRNAVQWSIAAAATPAWAAAVFNDALPDEQAPRLWEAILNIARADRPDPVDSWRKHLGDLAARRDYLNGKRYHALRLSAPGVDLTVGLADGHLWLGGAVQSTGGIAFTPNMPTEEVFTLPHRARVDGRVASSKPLNYGGTLIRNFHLEFAGGQVVGADAEEGGDLLKSLLDTDEGARQLGEVALVPHSSPVSQWGRLFYNTLFDENAATHMALGRGYRTTMAGSEAMSAEAFAAAGGNDSLVHVDFMVGTAQMDVDGLDAQGNAEPVMRGGEWAFEA
jgi:aminopeptidase